MATTLEALFTSALDKYDAENSYNIRVEKEYTSATASNYVFKGLSFFTEEISPYSTSVYEYEMDFKYNANGKITSVVFAQHSYYGTSYDFDTHSVADGAIANYSYYYDYSFTFGEKTEGTAPYDVASLVFTDYEVKTYSDYERTEEATTFDVEDNVYFSFVGSPEDSIDSPILESISGDRVCWASTGSTPNYIYLSNSGTATFTFVSASGIRKSVTITVKAPAPKEISFWGEIATVVPVNGLEALPSCDIEPYAADQSYEWKVVEGAEYGEIVYDAEYDVYSIKGLAAGTVKVQANSKVDPTIVTDVYEIDVLAAKTEAEMQTILTETDWAVNDGVIYFLNFNSDGTAVINFGYEAYYDPVTYDKIFATVETTYSFNWELDYSNGLINVTNGVWENRRTDGSYASFTDPVVTPSLLGDKVNVRFGEYYDYNFIEKLTTEEVKEAVVGQEFCAYFNSFHYAEIYFTVNAETVSVYTVKYDYSTGDQVRVNEVEFAYTWDADGNITLTATDLSYSLDLYGEVYNIVLDSKLVVENAFASYINLTFTCDSNTYTGRANKTS